MVNIYQTSDLFVPGEILASWNFEGEKKKRNAYKIISDQFFLASAKIYYQVIVLDRNIPSLNEYTNINALVNRIKLRIISQLEHLRPDKNSKITLYSEKLNKLSANIYNKLNIKSL